MTPLPPELDKLTPVPEAWDPVFYLPSRRPSAILILFIESETEENARILLIRRSTRIASHPGQIGFPGGRLEMEDHSPADTALREAQEEVGIDPSKVRIKGILQSLPALDRTLVFPVVGVISEADCQVRLNSDEVQEVYRIPWPRLSKSQRQKFSFNMFGCWRDSFLYDCGDITVWGLSAEILAKASF